jgi:hypothetical protein
MPLPTLANSENRLLNASVDIPDLQAQLRDQEVTLRMQILSVGIFQSGPANAANYTEVVANNDARGWPALTVTAVPAAIAANPQQLSVFFTNLALTNYIFDYAFVLIGGQEQLVVLTRPGVAPAAPEFANSPRLPAPQPAAGPVHQVKASSFADPQDVRAFLTCKGGGGSDQACFRKGDNGIGFCGDDCTGPTPMCALPPEDWMAKWGNRTAARLKPVNVTIGGQTVVCKMGDTMPHRKNITNGAGIDLSPAAVAAFGLQPPLMVDAKWSWV